MTNSHNIQGEIEKITDQFTQPGTRYLRDLNDKLLALFTTELEKAVIATHIEKMEILYALADMYTQYCDGPFGHDFMSAGEGAIEILENYSLASESKGVDYDAVDGLEKKIGELKALSAGDEE